MEHVTDDAMIDLSGDNCNEEIVERSSDLTMAYEQIALMKAVLVKARSSAAHLSVQPKWAIEAESVLSLTPDKVKEFMQKRQQALEWYADQVNALIGAGNEGALAALLTDRGNRAIAALQVVVE